MIEIDGIRYEDEVIAAHISDWEAAKEKISKRHLQMVSEQRELGHIHISDAARGEMYGLAVALRLLPEKLGSDK